MSKAAALREQAIAKFQQADALAGDNGPSPEDQDRFDVLFAEGQAIMARFQQQAKLEATAQQLTGVPRQGGGLAPGLPFPGAGGTLIDGETRAPRGSLHTQSWGARVVDLIGGATHGQMFAGILEPGSIPVSVPMRTPVVRDAERVQFLRQLIVTIPAPVGRYQWLRQTVRSHNAQAVPELQVKPTSVYTFETISDRTRTIAHISEPIARQQLADAPVVQQFIDLEMRGGLDLELDREILQGDGSGDEMTGFLDPTSGIQQQAFVSDQLTTTRKAVTLLQVIDENPSGFVLHPSDWETVELQAIEDFASNPNINPANSLTRRLWGLPVVVSTGIPAGTALLGDFSKSELYVTEEAVITWTEAVFDPTFGDAGASDWTRNALRFRAEMRANIAILRPLAFVAIDMGASS